MSISDLPICANCRALTRHYARDERVFSMCHVMRYEIARASDDRRSIGDRFIMQLGLDPMIYRLKYKGWGYVVERWPHPMFQNGTAPESEP